MASGFHFKGTVEVQVDSSRLEAVLAFLRDGDLEYDEGAIVKILADAGVTEGYDIDELVDSMQSALKSKEREIRVPAARGQPALPPVGETWVWDEGLLPLPDEQKSLAVRVTKAAGVPEIYQVHQEKTKVNRGGHVQVEVRETKQKVLVDPTVLKVFWVDSGVTVAKVSPPRPGVPGKDLGGKAIPAPLAKGGTFLCGAHLARQKTEIVAQRSGFLRVGRTWADIAAHQVHRWEVSYSSDRTSAYLTFEPGDPEAEPVSSARIVERLCADGFSVARLPSPETIDRLILRATQNRQTLMAEPLGADRDGTFRIHYSPDGVKAFLDIQKPLGRGASFSLKELGQTLRDAQLKDFSFDSVKETIQDFLAGTETDLKDFLLAEGKAPTRGQDLVLDFQTGFLSKDEMEAIRQTLKDHPKALDSVPHRQEFPIEAVEKASPVHQGQVFAKFVSPDGGEGVGGVDVHGATLEPIPGNEPSLKILANVRKHGEGLESTIDGLLETGTVDGVVCLRVRSHWDAMAVVTRSPDNMSATMTLIQGRGTGKRLDRALVDAALRNSQVNFGVDESAVESGLEQALSGTKVENLVVARGIPAANDLGRRLVFSVVLRTDAEGKQRGIVREGEIVATYWVPSADQEVGQDVLGNPLPTPEDSSVNLVVSSDFVVEDPGQGRQEFRATKGGEVIFDGESLSLSSQVAVSSVGGRAGSIKFPGDVVVAGAVETGGYVVAGNLKVHGRVGGALLSSDHNIQVADGIHGEGKAVLRAKRHVSVGFIERALVMAVGDVHVGKSALACTFRVNGRIFQKALGGGVQGGLVKVRLGMDVMNLGSASGQATSVSFGQDYLIEDQIAAETKETDKLREAIIQLDMLMRRLGAPADREKLNSARTKKVLLMKMLDKRNLRLIHLRDKFELHVPSEIIVRETLFPGVSIESHGRIYEPRGRRTAVRLTFNQQTGHIEEIPLE